MAAVLKDSPDNEAVPGLQVEGPYGGVGPENGGELAREITHTEIVPPRLLDENPLCLEISKKGPSKDVHLPARDGKGIENLAKYITRYPFSQAWDPAQGSAPPPWEKTAAEYPDPDWAE